ncbi:MAG TPA: c-type cytochrome [Gammaproteobacteria bacterium]|nr:c-type cytochrome [Gammaproteobacteria bacterium]
MTNAIPATFYRLLLSGLVVLVVFAWSSAAYSEAEVASDGDVHRGAVSWSNNCARCHEMRSPTEFRDDLWKPIVTHMRVRAGLTGQQQRDILAFLQASNNPLPATVAVSTAAEAMAGATLSGREIYNQTCVACHGAGGTGNLPGVPDFTAPGGPLSKPDEVLIRNITNGFQSPGSPMAMPAKGGNPDLGRADVQAVLGYLRESFGN